MTGAILARNSEVLDPSELRGTAQHLQADELAIYREAAYADGIVYEREHLQLYGLGVAARLELPEGLSKDGPRDAQALLDAITVEGDGPPGSAQHPGVHALGALAFLPGAPSSLTLSRSTVIVSESGAHLVKLAVRDEPFDGPPPSPVAMAQAPDAFTLESARSHADFLGLVEQALTAVAAGELEKVVIAREVTITANRPFVQAQLVERLRALYPSCATFALDGFIGASPELLVRRRDGIVEAHPLAGTIARSGDPEDDERRAVAFLANDKERWEHTLVVTAIAAALARVCIELVVPSEPELVELRNVSHLGTSISGRLAPTAGDSVLELVAELHPTPAVGGVPRDAALAFLARNEHLVRDRYAGPIGYVCAGGDGEFHLGIRSAIVDGARARLLAGVGIVRGSDAAAELAETQLKLQALLAAAVRP